MQIKWQSAALLLIAAFLLGLLLASSKTSSDRTVHEKEIIRTRVDTVRTIQHVLIRPLRIQAKATIHQDSACLDTLLRADTSAETPDTMHVCFAKKIFSLAFGFAPRRKYFSIPVIVHDTFYWQEDTVRIANTKAWYEDVLLAIVSVAARIVLGKL